MFFISYIEFYILCFPLPRVLCVVRGGNVTPAPLTGGPGGRVTRRRVGCPPRHMRPPALPAHMHHVHQLHMHIALAHLMHLMHHPCMRIKPFSDAPHQPYVLHQLSLQNHGCTIQPVNELSYFLLLILSTSPCFPEFSKVLLDLGDFCTPCKIWLY